jgi:transcription antitermination factor NusG
VLKVTENPPVTWPEKKTISDFEGQWWVAHTKSRNEKALAQELINQQISYFLPMRWKILHYKKRKLKSLLPLFGGYLFFCGDENDRLAALRTNRIANIIEVEDQQKLLQELLQIEKAIKSGASLQPHKYIKKGQHCQVTAGPLAKLTGVIVETKGSTRLVLQIDMLGQAASVEIDTDTIEVID